MGLRKGSAYRELERPYTRKSRVKSKSYIKTIPGTKIVKFQMGNPQKNYSYRVSLVSKNDVQVRDNAIEAARQTINRSLDSKLGKQNYFFSIRIYPHHILREHKMLTGAGADRLQSGMKLSFGKPIGVAAQVKEGDELFSVLVDKQGINAVKEAFKKASPKLPCTTSIKIESISKIAG